MSVPSYTRTTYNNRAAPAAGPTNLNKNEAQLKAISDEFTNELIRPATTKATIADADEVGGNNSANSFKWVKWTWTTIKAFLKTYFDTLYPSVSSGSCNIIVSFGGSSVGITYSSNQATWQLVGNRCTISGYIALTSKGSSTGALVLSGLPFVVKNDLRSYAPIALWLYSISFTGQAMGYVGVNTSNIKLEIISVGGAVNPVLDSACSNGSNIMFSATYEIA